MKRMFDSIVLALGIATTSVTMGAAGELIEVCTRENIIKHATSEEDTEALLKCVAKMAEEIDNGENSGSEAISVQNAEFTSGWTPYGGSYLPFRYGRSPDGLVIIEGMMSGCPDENGYVFVLPEGFRPSHRLIFSQMAGGNVVARVDVTPDGKIIYMHDYNFGSSPEIKNCATKVPGAKYLSLSGVVFSIAQ